MVYLKHIVEIHHSGRKPSRERDIYIYIYCNKILGGGQLNINSLGTKSQVNKKKSKQSNQNRIPNSTIWTLKRPDHWHSNVHKHHGQHTHTHTHTSKSPMTKFDHKQLYTCHASIPSSWFVQLTTNRGVLLRQSTPPPPPLQHHDAPVTVRSSSALCPCCYWSDTGAVVVSPASTSVYDSTITSSSWSVAVTLSNKREMGLVKICCRHSF